MRNKIAIGLISFALFSCLSNLMGIFPNAGELELKAIEKIELPERLYWVFNYRDFLN